MQKERNKKSFVREKTQTDKQKELLKKHGTIDIADAIRKQEEAKKKYTDDVSELEANIREFNERQTVLADPITGKAMAWIRNPTQKEWEQLVPQEFWKFRNDPDGVPQDLMQKYQDHQFEMMSKLVVKPKHDADWWKANANLPFQLLFQQHLGKVYEDLGVDVKNL